MDPIDIAPLAEAGGVKSTGIGACVIGMETGTNVIRGVSVGSSTTGASVIESSTSGSVEKSVGSNVGPSTTSPVPDVGLGVGLGVGGSVGKSPTSPQHPKKTPSSVGQQLPKIPTQASVAEHAAGSNVDGGAVIPSGILQSTSAKLYVTPSEHVNSKSTKFVFKIKFSSINPHVPSMAVKLKEQHIRKMIILC
jgi:hypothetical protein